jgi:galactonate dehydratase
MRVTEIEVHEIALDYDAERVHELSHYHFSQRRTIYVAHTDSGLVGLGESGSTVAQEVIDRYIGTNPFDWVGDETSLGLGTAMYDLMGKAAGVPVYKLIGPKRRSWVPVAGWTVATDPGRMARAVENLAGQGHTWMKFHLSPFENVFDQTEAMQAVAPPGFKLHYDFTMHGTDDHMPELLDGLAEYPIAGCFEDPLPGEDIEGYIDLRKRAKRPIVLHHFPMRATYEVLMQPADAYMLGHYTIGEAIQRAGLFAAGESPFMVQNTGGQITRAMAAHMMAAFPTGTFHAVSATESLAGDVVVERLQPVNGFVRVGEEPGLGLTLDREALERRTGLEPPEPKPWILKTEFKNGTRMYNLMAPDKAHFMVRPDWSGALPMSYAAPLATEYWDDDGSDEFAEMRARIEREDPVVVGG